MLYADGGGKRSAAPTPIHGRASIIAFFAVIAKDPRLHLAAEQMERVDINALPGFIVHAHDGVQTIAFEIAGDRIERIFVVRNPDKLRGVQRTPRSS